ncbi:MAG: hypothetical protein H6830_09435 [Planctomycetes bacterium]|nr:hypothetical protein [Planctomycetota bacterium]MCB9909946.1 hypothetical protein [Planctomycetota bacterium]MCB9912917.1 hypothetical protein [Planctomycetota bacterium]HPF13118.1 hypothetical protein [Planctomycetota bacterium]HRV80074.1 hypothetical protein [Planctomycetota bacterium]
MNGFFRKTWWIAGLAIMAGCQSQPKPAPVLGSARVVADFDSYTLRRIGLLPLEGVDPALAESRDMATTLAAEFAARTGLEVYVLSASEISEVPALEPHRQGRFDMRTVIGLGKRHRLDGLLVASVVEHKAYPPQRLALQVDLVSTETGMSLWFGQVQADASQGETQRAVEGWVTEANSTSDSNWQVVLISPKRFFRFACNQVFRQFAKAERAS